MFKIRTRYLKNNCFLIGWGILLLGLMQCGEITAPADVKPPITPQNFLLIGGGDGQVHFRWSQNSEPDFDKYMIYRSIDNPDNFENIAETKQSEFVDRFLRYDLVYFYYITALDFAGNESEPTAIIDVRPVNISSPASPSSVVVAGHNYPNLNQIEFMITWTPPNVSDLWKYLIYRGTEANFVLDANSFVDSTALSIYYDRNVRPGDLFYYRIVSVDLGYKNSIPSNPSFDQILLKLTLISPSNRIEFRAPFQFSWLSVPNAISYQVFVARAPLSDVIWTSAKIKEHNIAYSGSQLTSGAIYYWWVGAYSKDEYLTEDGIRIKPDVNSRSEIWTFFVR